jgi:hypothetical protein
MTVVNAFASCLISIALDCQLLSRKFVLLWFFFSLRSRCSSTSRGSAFGASYAIFCQVHYWNIIVVNPKEHASFIIMDGVVATSPETVHDPPTTRTATSSSSNTIIFVWLVTWME